MCNNKMAAARLKKIRTYDAYGKRPIESNTRAKITMSYKFDAGLNTSERAINNFKTFIDCLM